MRLTAGRDEDLAVPRFQHRQRQVRRRSETEQPYTLALLNARDPQTSESDDAGTEKWSRVEIVEIAGYRNGEVGSDQSEFGIAAVDTIAGVDGSVAEIFFSSPAVRTCAVG